jgi:TRAP-type C4-dicarboxylate transport system permease small subunit
MPAELESNNQHGFIARIDDLFAGLERWLIVVLLLSMIGLSFTQVVLRNFFSTGIDWADVVVRHMVLWVGLIGASIGAKEKRHLNIDIASRLVPAKWFHLVEALLCLVTAAVSLLFFWASYLFVRFLYEWGTGMLEGKAALLAGLILPLAFAGVALRFLRRAYLEVVDFWKKVSR